MEVLNYQEFRVTEDMYASSGKRIGNLVLDRIIFYLVIILLSALAYIISDFIGAVELMFWLENISSLEDILISAIIIFLYYFAWESLTSKTLAKYITKTKVVMIDGSKPSPSVIAVRTLSRFVPFDPFSFLGSPARGWHDRWAETFVVDEKVFEEQKEQYHSFKEIGIEVAD